MAEVSKPKTKSPFLSGVAGCLAGVCEISVTMPLDTIKTQMQLSKSSSLSSTVQRIYSSGGPGTSGGLSSFYSGFGAMLAQVSAKAGIRFMAFEQSKMVINKVGILSSPVQTDFVAGLSAGVIEAGVWVTPTERIKVLQQAAINNSSTSAMNNSLFSTITKLHTEQGVRGFFVGFYATAARQGSAMGIRFALYSKIKGFMATQSQILSQSNSQSQLPSIIIPTSVQLLISGMATGVISSLANQPIDTAKSRIQAGSKSRNTISFFDF